MVTAVMTVKQPGSVARRLVIAAALTLASAALGIAFNSWVLLHDSIEWPAVERSIQPHYPANHFLVGGSEAIALILLTGAASWMWLRALSRSQEIGLFLWASLSIGIAVPVAIFTSVALASPFIASAIVAVVVIATRRKPV